MTFKDKIFVAMSNFFLEQVEPLQLFEFDKDFVSGNRIGEATKSAFESVREGTGCVP